MGPPCGPDEKLQRQAVGTSTRGSAPPAECRAMQILVVEDEAKMAALIKRVLTAERHVVDVAPDG